MTPAQRKTVDLVKARIRLLREGGTRDEQLFPHLHCVEKFAAGAITQAMEEMNDCS